MKTYLLLAAGLCMAIISCNEAGNNEADKKDQVQATEMSDSTAYNSGSSSAAVVNNKDTEHKFVRTADLKFKAGNVEKTTYQVEDILASHHGFVTFTQLNSNTEAAKTVRVSEDSATEITNYTVTNNITFRVPDVQLDTTLKDISSLVDYLDYRVIKADDVSLQLYANELQQKRASRYVARLTQAIDNRGKKLTETSKAEENLAQTAAEIDDALVADKSLIDQVNYSTVQLAIYQRQAVKTTTVAIQKEIPAFEPGLGQRISNALKNGWMIIEMIFIGLLQMWPLFFLALAGVWIYRKYNRNDSAAKRID